MTILKDIQVQRSQIRKQCWLYQQNILLPYWQKGSVQMKNDLTKEPMWSDVCDMFDIEKVKRTHSNLSNPLFPVAHRLEHHLERDAKPSAETLSLTNRFFNFFQRDDSVSDARRYLFVLYSEDYSKFALKMMLLVQMIISEYPEYYY